MKTKMEMLLEDEIDYNENSDIVYQYKNEGKKCEVRLNLIDSNVFNIGKSYKFLGSESHLENYEFRNINSAMTILKRDIRYREERGYFYKLFVDGKEKHPFINVSELLKYIEDRKNE